MGIAARAGVVEEEKIQPEVRPLEPDDIGDDFVSGVDTIDDYLARFGLVHAQGGGPRTYVRHRVTHFRYTDSMTVINVRTDPKTDAALAQLTADGTSRSEAIRQAILNAAREATRRRMREEAERLRNDPDDLAEVRRVQEDMESLRAW